MRLNASQLRTLCLGLTLEELGRSHPTLPALPKPEQRQAALVAAMHQARLRRRGSNSGNSTGSDNSSNNDTLRVEDVALDYSHSIVSQACQNEPSLVRLQHSSNVWGWLAWLLPLISLALGLISDRINGASQLDLLSPPLLGVVLWNVLAYIWLVQRLLRKAAATSALSAALVRRGLIGRMSGVGVGRRRVRQIVLAFEMRWLAASAQLHSWRVQQLLHVCAAAWALGLALSLLLRGLVVEYRIGWESTFLDAAQVQIIINTLFAPLQAMFGLAAFELEDISAMQNFAQPGVAGSLWVWLYTGLLALAVVIPRLSFAAFLQWRCARWSTDLDLNAEPALRDLCQALPQRLRLGVMNASQYQLSCLQHWLDWHAQRSAPESEAAPQYSHSPRGDALVLVSGDSGVGAVDAVLTLDGERLGLAPEAWKSVPTLNLPWNSFASSWVQEMLWLERLEAVLPPEKSSAVKRISTAWKSRNEQRFHQACQLVAQSLKDIPQTHKDEPVSKLQFAFEPLRAQLRHLHGFVDNHSPSLIAPWEPPAPASTSASTATSAIPAKESAKNRSAVSSNTALALGTSAGAAAGAAAGAKAGAMIDVGTGGLTLGLGTAAGAVIGGATAWVMRDLLGKDKNNKDEPKTDNEIEIETEAGAKAKAKSELEAQTPPPSAAHDTQTVLTLLACLHYLEIAHQGRMSTEQLQEWLQKWRSTLMLTLQAQPKDQKDQKDQSIELEHILRQQLEQDFVSKV